MKQLYKFFILIVFVLVIAFVLYYFRDGFSLGAIKLWLNQYQPWTPLVFIFLYILATIFFLPGSVLTLAGGLLFGAWYGTLYNIIGATLGATVAFIIARYLASDWVEEKGGRYIHKILTGVKDEGWRFVAFVRFVPLFPFNLTNYLFGITKINLLSYVLTSFICMLPATFAYTYAGSLGEAFIHSRGTTLISQTLIGIGLFVLISVLPFFIKRYRKKNLKDHKHE